MYSIVIIIDNAYFKYAKRVDLNVLITYTKVAEGMYIIISLIVVIISQCVHISKEHAVYLKYINFIDNYVSLSETCGEKILKILS